MGNGDIEKGTKTGKLVGMAYNKNDKEQGTISLTDVMYLPNGKYNLLSLYQVMRLGWKLAGDVDHLSLSSHQTSSNLRYDSLFEADNYSTPSEDSNVILQQGAFTLSTLPSPSPVTTLTSNEMRTEVLLAFQPNDTGQPTLINCLIDTGCFKRLICETLVKDSEMLN
jgi:hypothetical protein